MTTAPSGPELLLASGATYHPGDTNYMSAAGLTPFLDSNGSPLTTSTANGTIAQAFMDSSGNIIIADQGTEPLSNLAQDEADLQIEEGEVPQTTFTDALAFATQVRTAAQAQGISDNQIYVTGHSLGGIEAEYVAANSDFGGASFGATGLPGNTDPGSGSSFVNYINGGDPVGNYAGDAAENGIAPTSMLYYGKIVSTGNAAANDVLTDQSTLMSSNIQSGYDSSNALEVLAGYTMSDHVLSSYASSLGVTLPTPTDDGISHRRDRRWTSG